jgi:hypothetical protein
MYNIFKVKSHNILKKKLLEKFCKYKNSIITTDKKNSVISNTDWNIKNCNREYFKYFLELEGENYLNFLKEKYPQKELGYTNFWFQQYERKTGSDHPPHKHDDVFLTNVYFVEMFDKRLSTKLIDVNNGDIIDTEVNEGEILIFSGNVHHFSPPNFTDYRKSVLVFNINPIL